MQTKVCHQLRWKVKKAVLTVTKNNRNRLNALVINHDSLHCLGTAHLPCNCYLIDVFEIAYTDQSSRWRWTHSFQNITQREQGYMRTREHQNERALILKSSLAELIWRNMALPSNNKMSCWAAPGVYKHHEQRKVCISRPKYRDGRKDKAVKVRLAYLIYSMSTSKYTTVQVQRWKGKRLLKLFREKWTLKKSVAVFVGFKLVCDCSSSGVHY